MKRGFTFTVFAVGFTAFALLDDAEARRFYYRNYYRSYNDYYDYHPDVYGISPPYARERRPLNVPQSGSNYYRPRSVFYMLPQPAPMFPYAAPVAWQSPYSYPSVFTMGSPYLTAPYLSVPSLGAPYAIRTIGPVQPTIIEREKVIIERPPAEESAKPSASSAQTPSYIPSKPVGEDEGFVNQLDRAQRLFRERNYQEAVEAYHKASGLNSGNALLKMGQAFSLLAVGDYESAASALRRALTLNPEWNEKPVLVATFYGDANDFSAHLARLDIYVKKYKENVEARFLQAYLYVVANRMNEAAELLAGILETQPNDLDATTLLGRIAAAKR